jgi:hypothetical protein
MKNMVRRNCTADRDARRARLAVGSAPLTLSLSLGERGKMLSPSRRAGSVRLLRQPSSNLPLPRGEGRGEGGRPVGRSDGAVDLAGARLKFRRRGSAALPIHGRADLPVRRRILQASAALLAAGHLRSSGTVQSLQTRLARPGDRNVALPWLAMISANQWPA